MPARFRRTLIYWLYQLFKVLCTGNDLILIFVFGCFVLVAVCVGWGRGCVCACVCVVGELSLLCVCRSAEPKLKTAFPEKKLKY